MSQTSRIDADTELYCLMGDPVGHSMSPVMHNAAFQEMGINAIYVAFNVRSSDLGVAVRGMTALGFAGANVTRPHKVKVVDYVRELHESAEQVGAVNTLVVGDDGWIGHNTDARGVEAVLQASDVAAPGCKAVVFGTGGGARAVVAALLTRGCSDMTVLGRNADHVRTFVQDASTRHGAQIKGSMNSPEEVYSSLREADLVVNATPVGMYPHTDESIVSPELLHSGMTVFDLVYRPRETTLLKHAAPTGARTIGGVEMLVEQGAASLELWLKREVPRDVMRKALERALG
ncbi:MAG: shikimate dehydrogenase [Candidatus Geothermarchaeales archaeon]